VRDEGEPSGSWWQRGAHVIRQGGEDKAAPGHSRNKWNWGMVKCLWGTDVDWDIGTDVGMSIVLHTDMAMALHLNMGIDMDGLAWIQI